MHDTCVPWQVAALEAEAVDGADAAWAAKTLKILRESAKQLFIPR